MLTPAPACAESSVLCLCRTDRRHTQYGRGEERVGVRGSGGRSLGEGTRIRPPAVPSGSLCTSQAPSHSELMVSPDHVGTPPHSPPHPRRLCLGPFKSVITPYCSEIVCTGDRRGGEPGREEGGGEEEGEEKEREPPVALVGGGSD